MFLISKPTEETIRRFIESQKDECFSYAEIGQTQNENAPGGYTVDHNRVEIGSGHGDFIRAIQAVRDWKMFDFSWAKICFENTPIEAGQTVAVLIRHFGFWSLNASRIIYTLHEQTSGDIEKFGFAYGTLAEHGESGEERFSVEFHKRDKTVWYDLYAFSRPNLFLAKLGYPLSRYLQKQFAIDSKKAMVKAVDLVNL